MPTPLRDAADAAARQALADLAEHPGPVRAMATDGKRVCLLTVYEVCPGAIPGPPARPADAGPTLSPRRAECRADILAALAAAGEPLTRRALVRVLRQRRTPHGAGTVAKAVGELTRTGKLSNPKDKKGYRLVGSPPRPRSFTPDLFD